MKFSIFKMHHLLVHTCARQGTQVILLRHLSVFNESNIRHAILYSGKEH